MHFVFKMSKIVFWESLKVGALVSAEGSFGLM